MARIAEEELERIKGTVRLEELVEAKGVALRRRGANLFGRCPLHEEQTPSLSVSPSKQVWKCFGCGKGGDVIAWVVATEGLSFRAAVERLQSLVPSLAGQSPPPAVLRRRTPVALDDDDKTALAKIRALYHRTLLETDKALAYLEGRGLRDDEAIRYHQLGYADRTLGLRIPESNRQEGAAARALLARIGILRADSGHEHLAGRVVAPIVNADGEVVGMYGRAITKGPPPHLNLDGPSRALWNEPALTQSKEVILCEAVLDGMSFWVAGFRNVVATCGASSFAPAHLEAFRRHGTRRVLLAFDEDDGGHAGVALVQGKLEAIGVECYRVHFPKGMDASEYAQRMKPAKKAFELVLDGAERLTTCAAVDVPAELEPVEDLAESAAEPAPVPSPNRVAIAEPVAAPFLVAASQPASTAPAMTVVGQEAVLVLEDREYRVTDYAQLGRRNHRVRLRVTRAGRFLVDTIDLYAQRNWSWFAESTARDLEVPAEVVRQDLRVLLGALEALVRELGEQGAKKGPPPMSAEERAEAEELLRGRDPVAAVLDALDRLGLVGERENKLLVFFVVVSRLLDRPLGAVVQSTAGSGKSALVDAVLELVPAEQREQFSAMTEHALYYMGALNLQHKVLAISEGEGAERAAYALKLLQSEGKLRMAVPMKDAQTGKIATQDLSVEGPVATLMTTAGREIDEELLGRNFVLTVDEDRDQTRAILERQRERETLEGLFAAEEKRDILRLHQNAQRLLRPLHVVNPYARALRFADHATRTRRDHMKYLVLIRAIALFHQHQRPLQHAIKSGRRIEYIEVTLEDIALANELANHTLGRSLDEMPPQTRRLLHLLDELATRRSAELGVPRAEVRLSRRDVRTATAWSETQLRLHLDRLVALEYLVVHRGGFGQRFVYELCYDASRDGQERFTPGLLDVEALRATTTIPTSRGLEATSRGGSGGGAATSRGAENGRIASPPEDLQETSRSGQGGHPPLGEVARPESQSQSHRRRPNGAVERGAE